MFYSRIALFIDELTRAIFDLQCKNILIDSITG